MVQTAAKLVLEPIFEADLSDSAFGYRPGRSARGAVARVHRAVCDGYTDVVDADLSKYFDTIPHDQLMKSVARRITDGKMLKLIKAWLKAPVEETDERGNRRMTGGKGAGGAGAGNGATARSEAPSCEGNSDSPDTAATAPVLDSTQPSSQQRGW